MATTPPAPPRPQPPHPASFDFAESPLTVGQMVAFVAPDTDRLGEYRLYDGEIVHIGETQLVVDSGDLVIMQGRKREVGSEEMLYVGVHAIPCTPEIEQHQLAVADAEHEVYVALAGSGEWAWRCEGIRHCTGDLSVGHASRKAAVMAYAEHAVSDHGTEPTEAQLHARCAHPGFEYATTEGQRKQWDDADTPPTDDHGTPDPTWERNIDRGRNGWDRFDYTEESYWRRQKPGIR